MKRGRLFLGLFLVIVMSSMALAIGAGGNIGGGGTIEGFIPRVFMDPNARIVLDDYTSPGAITEGGEEMIERLENYAFEGEQVLWSVLVWDKNGKENIAETYVKIFNTTDDLKEAGCFEVEGCYGTPAAGTCSNYNYTQCGSITGCSLICDRYVDIANVCDGKLPCDTTIQAAINAAAANDLICVFAGTYNEDVNINNALTLKSVSGADTTIISGSGSIVVTIDADNVIFDGFTVTNGQISGIGIYAQDNSDLTIRNNILTDIGNSGDDVVARGIVIVSTSLDVDNVKITNNQINNIVSGKRTGTSSTSSSGISVGWSTGTEDITNLLIQGNIISDIDADTSDWTLTTKGQGAYGILLNHGTSGGQTIGAQILNNEISDLEGLWAHAIGLEGDMPNAVVKYNTISDLTDHKTPSDAVAVQFEDNPSADTVEVTQNNLLNANLGVQNTMALLTVTAEENWWGCTLGPGNPGCSDINGDVDYTPWAASEIDIPDYAHMESSLCDGTPDSCDIIEEEYKCEAETGGCYWYNGIRDIDIWDDAQHITELDNKTMRWYNCIFTVETPDSMHGQYYVNAEAEDSGGLKGESAETETWFFNPTIALGISGDMDFGIVRPGGTYKSSTITVGNAAEDGSGVLLDMYIAGTNFYGDIMMCPTTNQLSLTNFRYYASNGAYNTCDNDGVDSECYDDIPYEVSGEPNNNMQRIIDHNNNLIMGEYPPGNVLSPGSEISMNFKLALPKPCDGTSFDQGEIKLYGEAV